MNDYENNVKNAKEALRIANDNSIDSKEALRISNDALNVANKTYMATIIILAATIMLLVLTALLLK